MNLSDGKPIEVRRLGLFELADFELPKPFKFTILTITGQFVEQEFDFSLYPEPPNQPLNQEPNENSPEWFELKEYELYQAALAYRIKTIEAYQELNRNVADHILSSCVNPEDKKRIIEPTDYTTIYHLAIVPQLSMEALENELSDFFQSYLQWFKPIQVSICGRIAQISEFGKNSNAPAVGM